MCYSLSLSKKYYYVPPGDLLMERLNIKVNSNKKISGKERKMSARIESGGRKMVKIKEPK